MNSTMAMLDFNLEHLINGVLIEKAANNDRDYGHFHPSEFDNCHRKLVYKYYEYEGVISASEPHAALIDPQLQRIFDTGHGMHHRLGLNLQQTGLLKGVWRCRSCGIMHGKDEKLGVHQPKECSCDADPKSLSFKYNEVGFYDEETMIGGHVDAVLNLRGQEVNGEMIPKDASDEDSHIVVDFKTIRMEAFRRLSGPQSYHTTQMQVYLFLSGLKFGKFLYENKNDQSFREFLVPRDDALIQTKVSEAKAMKQIVKGTNSDGKRTLPARAHKKDNAKECVECPFRSHCWGLKK